MRQPTDYTYRGSVALRFLGLIVFATAAALTFLPADLRPTILRAALVAGLAIALLHVLGRLIDAAREAASSPFTQALAPPRLPVHLDAGLTQIRDEVRYSKTSRRYFDKVLWPRLVELAARRGIAADELEKPASSPFPRRGISLASLAALVDQLETRR